MVELVVGRLSWTKKIVAAMRA